MNTNQNHTGDNLLDDALRTLDVADHELTPAQLGRKQTLLRDLLATDSSGAHRGASGETAAHTDAHVVPITAAPGRRAERSRRSRARWLLPAAAAAALVGAMVVAGQPGEKAAYASWTPDPTPVSGELLTTAENACRKGVADSASRDDDLPPELRPTTKPEDMATVVAERRGDYLFLAMADGQGSTSQCFFDASDPSKPHGMTGSAATSMSPAPTELGRDGLEGAGGGAASGPEGSYAFAEGRVGSDVTGVTVHADGTAVRATVTNGYFAAWWPIKPVEGVMVSPIITYDVALRDGTVRTDVSGTPGEPAPAAPGPREVGHIERGGGVSDAGEVATAGGHVGSEVTGVTINVEGKQVVATVKDGTFTAEWPSTTAGEVPPITFDLTLKDGTVLKNQQPTDATNR
ncbi:MAG: hypothetical protein Q4G51_05805 [Dermatophilus congolensis]|nr:hypothetical protein [Dermatophilus congolensis]